MGIKDTIVFVIVAIKSVILVTNDFDKDIIIESIGASKVSY